MDGRRFDDLARSLASGAATRRRLLTGAVAAVVGAVTGGRLQPGEAQTACPPGQVRRAGLGCVCKTTGRPPVGGQCPCLFDANCPAGNVCFNGACACAPGGCGVFPECQGNIDCSCTATAAGPFCAHSAFCDEVQDCVSDADCPAGAVCGLGFCCGDLRPNTCAVPCGAAPALAAAAASGDRPRQGER